MTDAQKSMVYQLYKWGHTPGMIARNTQLSLKEVCMCLYEGGYKKVTGCPKAFRTDQIGKIENAH